MGVPEITLGADGHLESFTVKTIQGSSEVREGVRFGIALTSGKKERSISMDEAGLPVVEERKLQPPGRSGPER